MSFPPTTPEPRDSLPFQQNKVLPMYSKNTVENIFKFGYFLDFVPKATDSETLNKNLANTLK